MFNANIRRILLGKIHSIETFGAVDGPGIRFVIFMQGCPMRCKYCHNPDTWDMFAGKDYTVEQLLSEIRKYRHYFGSDGGVTVSGGEPLAQIDFVTKLFKMLKAENIHTCIDTSGALFNPINAQKYEELLKYTDLVLLDIKHIDSAKHKLLTGFDNVNILEFARFLNKLNKPVWIRHVLVPTLTDDIQSLNELKAFLTTLDNIKKVEVLPYHCLGVSKYDKLGIDYPLNNLPSPTEQQINIANKILRGENK